MAYAIEPLQPSDWEEVRVIYLQGIATRNATFETGAPSWPRWHSSHFSFGRLVPREDGVILGWTALGPVSDRCCYSGVAEVSVYVEARHLGHGIGTALLRATIAASEKNGIWTVQAGIFPENLASLALVKQCGFREVGRGKRLGRLDGTWRDVLLLERRSEIVGL